MFTLKRIFDMDTARSVYVCLTGAGVIVFMLYCMRIKYLPTGLTISDVIFFLMVITSFSLLLIFFLALWFSMALVVSWLFVRTIILLNKMRRKRLARSFKGTIRVAKLMRVYNALPMHIVMSLVGGIVIYPVVVSGKNDVWSIVSSVIITSVVITIIPNIYYDKRIRKESKRKHLTVAVISALVLFFVVSGMASVLSDAGMNVIGVRKNDVTFLLKEKDLEMARYLTGDSHQNLFKGDALFTGVGSTSLLVINDKKMIVNNENLSISY